MNIVGADFRDGILFVPEVLLAANAMKAGMAILKPILAETGAEPIGKMVIGTTTTIAMDDASLSKIATLAGEIRTKYTAL